jgi:hypothetical protein
MFTPPRWVAECRVMKYRFPTFEPIAEPGLWAGFRGLLQGKRTKELYDVLIRALIRTYPSEEPAIYMNPHPEPHHWILDGRLCYQREGHVWNPAEDTFVQALGIAVKYLDEFDGRG